MQRPTSPTWNIAEETARWSYAADMLDAYGADGVSVIMNKMEEGRSAGNPEAVDFWLDLAGRAQALASSVVH